MSMLGGPHEPLPCSLLPRSGETSPSSSHLSAPANNAMGKARLWCDKNSAGLCTVGLKVLLVG